MIPETVKLVWFSPTGTTKAVVHGIAKGIDSRVLETTDITLPQARTQPLAATENELLVIGVPVYMGRVPALLGDWLGMIQTARTPAVCVVVYGNRAYENALLELCDIVRARGCIPVAGAAFIGEHSFSSPDTPTAQGRPDTIDLDRAEQFGLKIRAKMEAIASLSAMPDLTVPGACPYGGSTTLWDVDFIEVDDRCVHCGVCAEVCPQGAVDPHRSSIIDHKKCITCCACIKSCPRHARTMKPGPVMDAAQRLHSLYGERKEPECFL